MLRMVRVGCILLGAGVVAGGGVILWLRLHPAESPVVVSKGGSVVLDAASTPSPTPAAGDLHVSSPSAVAAAGGSPGGLLPAGSLSGGGTAGADTKAPEPSPSGGVPSPGEFGAYEKYHDSSTALFGDLVAGAGPVVTAGSVVTVNYRGWLTNGKEFDESYTRGKPYSFTEGEHKVILGWEEGLMGMKVGGKRRLIIPPGVGYGPTGHDPIPPNSLLVFDVELVGVQ